MQTIYKPGQPLRASGGSESQNFYTLSTRRWQGCEPYAPATFTHQEISLVLISVKGWIDPRAIMWLEWLNHWKIPTTPSAMEPTTFWLVAQCLNQLCHCTPLMGSVLDKKNIKVLCFNWREIEQYGHSKGNTAHKIFSLGGCSKWGVKIISSQDSTITIYNQRHKPLSPRFRSKKPVL
jgi:hypothetical protein